MLHSLMLHSNIFPQIMCLCILIMPKNHAVMLKVLQVPLPNATIVHDIRGAVDLMVATNEEDIFLALIMWHGHKTTKGWQNENGDLIPFSTLTERILSLTNKRVHALFYSCFNAKHPELVNCFRRCIAFETTVSRVNPAHILPLILDHVQREHLSATSFMALSDKVTNLTKESMSIWAGGDKLITICCFENGDILKRNQIREVKDEDTGCKKYTVCTDLYDDNAHAHFSTPIS